LHGVLEISPVSKDVGGRLRSLAKEYAEGRLSLEDYRRLRTSLLDSLTAYCGDDAEEVMQPRSLPEAAASDGGTRPPLAAGVGRPMPPALVRVWTLARARWMGVLVLAVLVAGTAGLFVRERSRSPPAGDEAGAPPAEVSAGSDRIFLLVAPLLNNPDWGDSRIAAVNAALLEEGSRQIAARQRTEWFQHFAAEVRRRLAQQRALGADRLVPEKSSLAALAVTIGLDPRVPDEPLQAPAHDDSTARHRERGHERR